MLPPQLRSVELLQFMHAHIWLCCAETYAGNCCTANGCLYCSLAGVCIVGLQLNIQMKLSTFNSFRETVVNNSTA